LISSELSQLRINKIILKIVFVHKLLTEELKLFCWTSTSLFCNRIIVKDFTVL